MDFVVDLCNTPVKVNKKQLPEDTVKIPATPFMKKIGYGTGVAVYELKRSPLLSKFQSPWAIKKLLKGVNRNKETNRKRLCVEAELLRQLKHPNIVGFRQFLEGSDGEPCLAMEECDFCLGNAIEERQETVSEPFPANKLLKVGLDISAALDYLHNEALLMHCDIKSYNILIKGDFDNCKICDFGVSLPVDEDGNLDVTKAGKNAEYIGTPIWSAPEVSEYPQKVTTKADIYAFGLVLWEMLALMPPLDEDTINSSMDLDVSDSDDSCMIIESSGKKKRPPLPDFDFGVEYQPVLEVYNLCTFEDLKIRPAAQHLHLLFRELFSKK